MGKAEGWGKADKRHLSVCGTPGPWLWFLLTNWPNQHSEPKGELVSSHVLLRCLHDVRVLVGRWMGCSLCLCKCQCEFKKIKARAEKSHTRVQMQEHVTHGLHVITPVICLSLSIHFLKIINNIQIGTFVS